MTGLVKCVVWDLDNTLLAGILAESSTPPGPDPAMLAALTELAGRGVLASVASRNPAELADRATAAADWPTPFVAPQYGWGRKSDSVRRVAAELRIGLDAVAFVDDDGYERAEVAFALPEVLVLAPDQVAEALHWPQFCPDEVTDEALARADAYARARARDAAAAQLGRSRAEFLRYCRTAVAIAPATAADLPRLHELSVRTHQFNSARAEVPLADFRSYLDSARHRVLVLRLSDRFGDDGLVGAAVVESTPDSREWTVGLLMMSCRAMGRGVIEILLGWLAHQAAVAGADALSVGCRLDERNVPLRLALVAGGFRADSAEPDGDGRTWFRRSVAGAVPELPDWAEVTSSVGR